MLLLYCYWCCDRSESKTSGYKQILFNPPTNRYETETLNHRFKREGFIPFRPLFVYRQQQIKKQARWKWLEAQKLLKKQLIKGTSMYSYGNYPVYQTYSTYRPSFVYQQNPYYDENSFNYYTWVNTLHRSCVHMFVCLMKSIYRPLRLVTH